VAYGEKQGTMYLGADAGTSRNYSEDIAKKIDTFARTTLEDQGERAVKLLKDNLPKLHALAKVLLKKESMSLEEFKEIFEGKMDPEEAIEKEEKKDKAAEESGTDAE
jgi:cell division protease FtsH